MEMVEDAVMNAINERGLLSHVMDAVPELDGRRRTTLGDALHDAKCLVRSVDLCERHEDEKK